MGSTNSFFLVFSLWGIYQQCFLLKIVDPSAEQKNYLDHNVKPLFDRPEMITEIGIWEVIDYKVLEREDSDPMFYDLHYYILVSVKPKDSGTASAAEKAGPPLPRTNYFRVFFRPNPNQGNSNTHEDELSEEKLGHRIRNNAPIVFEFMVIPGVLHDEINGIADLVRLANPPNEQLTTQSQQHTTLQATAQTPQPATNALLPGIQQHKPTSHAPKKKKSLFKFKAVKKFFKKATAAVALNFGVSGTVAAIAVVVYVIVIAATGPLTGGASTAIGGIALAAFIASSGFVAVVQIENALEEK